MPLAYTVISSIGGAFFLHALYRSHHGKENFSIKDELVIGVVLCFIAVAVLTISKGNF
jgi:hypothetical protein